MVRDWLSLGACRGKTADCGRGGGGGGGVGLRRRQDDDRSRERSFGGEERCIERGLWVVVGKGRPSARTGSKMSEKIFYLIDHRVAYL